VIGISVKNAGNSNPKNLSAEKKNETTTPVGVGKGGYSDNLRQHRTLRFENAAKFNSISIL